MKKYDKMVLRAIANEFDVIQGKVTFLESFSRGGFITRLTFRIEYNKFENIFPNRLSVSDLLITFTKPVKFLLDTDAL